MTGDLMEISGSFPEHKVGAALLFINGVPPVNLPQPAGFDVVACTDGAFSYLVEKKFPLEKLTFLAGDFDSQTDDVEVTEFQQKFGFEIIPTPDQEKTDFAKILDLLLAKGISAVSVYGGSGGEMDHFLGNLTVALQFKDRMRLTFFDEFQTYFFAPQTLVIKNVRGKTISLYPFPRAENITTKGLRWPLLGEDLDLAGRIGTRNEALENEVEITFSAGELVIFIEK